MNIKKQNQSTKKVSFAAVVRYQGVDENDNPMFSWRRCSDQGRWLDTAEQGNVSQLDYALAGSNREVCLVLPSESVITACRDFSAKERRHIQKLLPYEIENDLTSELDDLHFAYGRTDDSKVVFAYADRELIATQLQLLEANDIEVHCCISESLTLPWNENTWTLRSTLSMGCPVLDVRCGLQQGFTVAGDLSGIALEALCNENSLPENIFVISENQDQSQALLSLLPSVLTQHLDQSDSTENSIESQLLDKWDSFDFANYNTLDLRQGEFARRLPVKRWSKEWRAVAIIACVAVVAFLAVNIGQIQQYKSARAELNAKTIDAARQVIPQGVIQDARRQINTRLAAFRGTSSATNSVKLLSLVTPVTAEAEGINVGELRYNQARNELRLVLEADSDKAIEEFRKKLSAKSLEVDPGRSAASGDKYSVQMAVRLSGS